MSYYLDSVLDDERRAQCAAHDAADRADDEAARARGDSGTWLPRITDVTKLKVLPRFAVAAGVVS